MNHIPLKPPNMLTGWKVIHEQDFISINDIMINPGDMIICNCSPEEKLKLYFSSPADNGDLVNPPNFKLAAKERKGIQLKVLTKKSTLFVCGKENIHDFASIDITFYSCFLNDDNSKLFWINSRELTLNKMLFKIIRIVR